MTTIRVSNIKGHYREEGGSLIEGSLVFIDVPGKGICTKDGAPLRARRVKVSSTTECIELYGPQMGFNFLPDEGECERVGIPVDPAE